MATARCKDLNKVSHYNVHTFCVVSGIGLILDPCISYGLPVDCRNQIGRGREEGKGREEGQNQNLTLCKFPNSSARLGADSGIFQGAAGPGLKRRCI